MFKYILETFGDSGFIGTMVLLAAFSSLLHKLTPVLMKIVAAFVACIAIAMCWQWWKWRARVAAEQAARAVQRAFSLMPESVREGSEFYAETVLPPYMFALYSEKQGKKIYVGSGYRTGNWIVMPWHVIKSIEGDALMKWSTPRKDGTYEEHWYAFEADVNDGFQIGADIIAYNYKPEFVGLKSAKIGMVPGRVMVQCVSLLPNQNASIGLLFPNREMGSGILQYEGSTRSGFSGGVYRVGDRVVGIHNGGGAINYGYAATWIQARLVREESSDLEQIRAVLSRARKHDVEWTSTGSPDEMELRIGGRYYILDYDDYTDLYDEFEELWETEEEREAKQSRRERRRKEFEDQMIPENAVEEDSASESGSDTSTESGNEESLPDSKDSEEAPVIGQVQQTIVLIPSMEDFPRLDLDGQRAMMQQWLSRLDSMPATALAPMSDMCQSFEKKFSTLLANLKPTTKSPTADLQGQENQSGSSGLTTASEPSTQAAPQDSANSKNGPPLVTAWAGQAEHLKIYREWKRCADPLSADFLERRKCLLDSLGLSPEQQRVLMKTVRGSAKKHRHQANKKRREPQPTSSSS